MSGIPFSKSLSLQKWLPKLPNFESSVWMQQQYGIYLVSCCMSVLHWNHSNSLMRSLQMLLVRHLCRSLFLHWWHCCICIMLMANAHFEQMCFSINRIKEFISDWVRSDLLHIKGSTEQLGQLDGIFWYEDMDSFIRVTSDFGNRKDTKTRQLSYCIFILAIFWVMRSR